MSFNRFEGQCLWCSCYIDNWDNEISKEETDSDCSLEQDTSEETSCWGFDVIRRWEKEKK